jgi:type III pantothenate kinase
MTGRLLLVDIGNSALKWRLVSLPGPEHLPTAAREIARSPARSLSHQDLTVAALMQDWGTALEGLKDHRPVSVQWLSVGPAASTVLVQDAFRALTGQPASAPLQSAARAVFKAGPGCQGLRNGYRQPAQLGADRWSAGMGCAVLLSYAASVSPGHHLVVGSGTATTLDLLLVASNGEISFLGGWILPGPRLMHQSLTSGTKNLAYEFDPGQLCAPDQVPTDTAGAMMSGIVYAQTGAILQLLSTYAIDHVWLHGGQGIIWRGILEGLRPALVIEDCPSLPLLGLAAVGWGIAQPLDHET